MSEYTWSDEQKAKLSAYRKGKKWTPNQRKGFLGRGASRISKKCGFKEIMQKGSQIEIQQHIDVSLRSRGHIKNGKKHLWRNSRPGRFQLPARLLR